MKNSSHIPSDEAEHNDGSICVVELSDYSTVSISGPDAQAFLQGQLTCDVNSLTERSSGYGAHCNAKGRIISNFILARPKDDFFILRWHQSINELAIAALKKYMVFSKASLKNEPDWKNIGLLGSSAESLLETLLAADTIEAYHRISPSQIECLVSPDCAEAYAKLTSELPHTQQQYTWRQKLIAHGVVNVNKANSENYLPQELNLEQLGGISFKKGCYTGQEVIARLHYKGKLKKTLKHGSTNTNDSVSLDQTIYSRDTNKKIGSVVCSETHPNHNRVDILALVDSSEENPAHILIGDETIEVDWHDILEDNDQI